MAYLDIEIDLGRMDLDLIVHTDTQPSAATIRKTRVSEHRRSISDSQPS